MNSDSADSSVFPLVDPSLLSEQQDLPWEVTEGPALEPGIPGDIPEEAIESLRELNRGMLPWESEGEVDLMNVNGAILAGLAVLGYFAWRRFR